MVLSIWQPPVSQTNTQLVRAAWACQKLTISKCHMPLTLQMLCRNCREGNRANKHSGVAEVEFADPDSVDALEKRQGIRVDGSGKCLLSSGLGKANQIKYGAHNWCLGKFAALFGCEVRHRV